MYKITTLIYVNEGPGTANSRKFSQRKAIMVVKLADLDISLKYQLHKWCNFLDLNLLQETFMTFSLHSRSRKGFKQKNQIFNSLYVPPFKQCGVVKPGVKMSKVVRPTLNTLVPIDHRS